MYLLSWRPMNDLMAIQKIAQWQKVKALMLDSISSPITKRVSNMALNEFMAWFQQAPRSGFTKAAVSAWLKFEFIWAPRTNLQGCLHLFSSFAVSANSVEA